MTDWAERSVKSWEDENVPEGLGEARRASLVEWFRRIYKEAYQDGRESLLSE